MMKEVDVKMMWNDELSLGDVRRRVDQLFMCGKVRRHCPDIFRQSGECGNCADLLASLRKLLSHLTVLASFRTPNKDL